jgi:hypothetical protein
MFDLEHKLLKLTDGQSKGDIGLKDVLNNTDLSKLVPIAISEVVREAAEPHLIANQLFNVINQRDGIYIQLPALGAMDTIEEVAPGAEYGTEEITMGGGAVIRVDIRKYGIKLALTEEMIEQSQWDIISFWLKAAGKAFARKKNRICFNLFEKQALTLVDNKNPTASVLQRPLTGRDGAGNWNYSFTAEDFFDVYAAMLQEGFAPTVIVMHPMSWAMWVKDPILRVFAWRNGSGPLFNAYDVQGVKRDDFFSGLGMSKGGPRPGENMPVDFKGTPILPPYLNVPFSVMVSPQVPFDPVAKTTSIYFIDPENAGAIVQAENINHFQWTDPERDIQAIRLREKYGISMLNEGRGVGVVKNVKVVPNRMADFGYTTATLAASGIQYPEMNTWTAMT